jgi:hypothetical protein
MKDLLRMIEDPDDIVFFDYLLDTDSIMFFVDQLNGITLDKKVYLDQ